MRKWTVLGAALLSSCSGAHKAPPPPPQTVQVSVAKEMTLTPTETLAGTAAPYQNVAIQETSISEPALSVNVNEGDIVHRGEVLATLNTDDLQASMRSFIASAKSYGDRVSQFTYTGVETIVQSNQQVRFYTAALAQTKATLKNDTINLLRYQQLYKQQYIPLQTLQLQQTTVRNDQQSVRSEYANLQSAISAVQANGTINQGAQASNIQNSVQSEAMAYAQADQMRAEISRGTIVSPVNGVITNRNFNPGEYPGTRQIFTVQQLDPLYAVFQASSSETVGVEKGSSVTIHAVDTPQTTYKGTIIAVLGQVTPGSTNFIVKAELRNPNYALRAGTVLSGTIQESSTRGIGIPATAFLDESHDSVLTVDSNGMLHQASVQQIRTNFQTAIVTGLAPGTRVVTNGDLGLSAGDKVAIAQ
jgi:multidrug efflux pump subunit AcrA (membrane-fusion protein)